MNVKQPLLPKVMPRTSSASVSQSERDSSDEKKLSTDVLPSASSPSLSNIRDAIIATLLTPGTSTNRFYTGSIGPNYGGISSATLAGFVQSLNNVAVGTNYNQRLGDSCRGVRLRLRIHLRNFMLPDALDLGTAISTDATRSGAVRIAVVRDKMPVINTPACYDTSTVSTNPPASSNALWTFPTWAGGSMVQGGPAACAIRNPQTLSRFEILREHLCDFGDTMPSIAVYTTGGSTVSAGGQRMSSRYIDWDIDLHGIITEWYDQANSAAQMTNKLYLMAISDASNSNPTGIIFNSEYEFVNPE